MAIPDFQTIMRPLLEHLANGATPSNRQTIESLSQTFKLTEQELSELLPSGQQSTFTNRVAWAKAHLKKAGLLESPSRGLYKITPRGLEAIAQKGNKINLKYLKQFEEYSFDSTSDQNIKNNDTKQPDILTPYEYIETGYQKIREALEEELLSKIKASSPAFFERLVVELLVAMGYGGSRKDAAQTIG